MMGFKATNEFETTNYKVIAYIDTILKGGNRTSIIEADLINNHTNQYVIKLSNDLSESSCKLYYDTLYNKAYFQKFKGFYEVEVDFARYIDSFLENSDIEVNIDDTAAVALFDMYGWTLNYKINSMEQKINNINSLTAFNPNAYYFAYNNELSKDIGLDMSEYSNTSDITVDIYRVNESMPKEFYPIQNGRGIVAKYDNKIIGAFISAGRHSTFNACSLKGNSFENVTGQNLNEWLSLPLSGAEIGARSSLSNLKSAKLLKVEPIYDTNSNSITFAVTMDMQYKKEWANNSGEQFWNCIMIYESPQTGWKIVEFGH